MHAHYNGGWRGNVSQMCCSTKNGKKKISGMVIGANDGKIGNNCDMVEKAKKCQIDGAM